MTIAEAIAQADEMCKNPYSTRQKLVWLSRAEAMVKEIVDAHEGGEDVLFSGFDDQTPKETGLIMPEPYDECYIHYLQAQIYYANEEIDRYNRAITMFNALFDDFKGSYKKSHMPKGCGRFRF